MCIYVVKPPGFHLCSIVWSVYLELLMFALYYLLYYYIISVCSVCVCVCVELFLMTWILTFLPHYWAVFMILWLVGRRNVQKQLDTLVIKVIRAHKQTFFTVWSGKSSLQNGENPCANTGSCYSSSKLNSDIVTHACSNSERHHFVL